MKKKNEALVVVVEPSIDQKISNTGHKFNRIFSIDSFLTSKKNRRRKKRKYRMRLFEIDEKEEEEEKKRTNEFLF
jgi:hypothetical protein